MSRPSIIAANKIGGRYLPGSARAGVSLGRGAAVAGEIGAQLGLVGLDRCQGDRGGSFVENQGLGGCRRGGVASLGVASLAVPSENQGLAAKGRQIASYPTGSSARAPAAAGGLGGRSAGGGVPPRGGPVARLTPRSARQGSRQKARAAAPFEALQAQQGPKNREENPPAPGVGGGATPRRARIQSLKRLNSRAKAHQGGQKSGRGETSPGCLRWRKAGRLCRGHESVN